MFLDLLSLDFVHMTRREAILFASCAFFSADGAGNNGITVKKLLCLAETSEKQTKEA